jgi:hypothetical protein
VWLIRFEELSGLLCAFAAFTEFGNCEISRFEGSMAFYCKRSMEVESIAIFGLGAFMKA